MTTTNSTFINTVSALENLTLKIAETSTIYLDTEFIKRNTYYPILGLLQINLDDADNTCYLIDAVELDLTEDFWSALFSVELIVMHACSEDVDLLCLEAASNDLPPVFDTQIGLSFLGSELEKSALQIGYQEALKQMLGVEIDKGESCSDWLARPLRPEQLEYATNDVKYLPSLYKKVSEKLTEKRLMVAALEDTQSLCHDVLTTLSDDDIYTEWADFRYKPKELAQLQNICRWREQQAREENIPRTFVIKKSSLREIIQEKPRNKAELAKIRDFRHRNIKQYGETILRLMVELPDEADFPKKVARPFKEPKELGLSQQIKALVKKASDEVGLPADVLMRKRWLTKLYQLVAYQQVDDAQAVLPNYVTGWRWDVVTLPLIDVLMQHEELLRQHIVPREQW